MAENDVEIRIRVSDQTAAGLRDVNGRLHDEQGRFLREGQGAGGAFSNGFRSGLNDLKKAGSEAGDSLKSVFGSVLGLGSLGSITGGLDGLVAAISNVAGAALIVPGAIAAAGAAVAAFKVGTSGVMDAIGTIGTPATGGSSGGGASTKIANAKAIRSAQDQIVSSNQAVTRSNQQLGSAERGVASAERAVVAAEQAVVDAKHQVVEATQSYQDALDAEAEAQQNVQQARESAARQLEDSLEAVRDAALGQEGASIALDRAQENLIKTQRDVKSTADDLEEAQYQVKVAQDGVTDAATTATRAQEDNTAAQAKGVDHADSVVSANDALHASQEAVTASSYAMQQAVRGVIDAQQGVADADQGVADAQQQLVDAQQAVVDAQHKAAEAVQDLSDTLAEQKAAAAAAVGGTDAYAAALAKLSPNARSFVSELKALAPAWATVQNAVQDDLFKGFADDVKSLAGTYLPVLKAGLGGIASAFNGMAQYAAKALLDPAAVAAINNILGNTKKFLDNASSALGDFLTGFLKLASIGSDFLPDMGTWLSDIARHFKDWVTQNPDKIRDFITDGLQALRDIKDIAGNVVGIFKGLFSGSPQDGKDFLGTVKDVTGWLLQVAPIVHDVAPVLAALWLAGKAIAFGQAIVGVVTGIRTVVGVIKDWSIAQGILDILLDANPIGLIALAIAGLIALVVVIIANWDVIGPWFAQLWAGIVGIFQDAINWITSAASFIWDTFLAASQIMWGDVVATWNNVLGFLAGVWAWITATLSTVWNGLTTALGNAWRFVVGTWNGLLGFLGGAWSWITSTLATVWNSFTTALGSASTWVVGTWNGIAGFLGGIGAWITNTLSTVWNGFTGALSGAINWAQSVWGNFQGVIGGAVNWIKGVLAGMWDGLAAGARGAANAAIWLINGLIDGLNYAIDGLNSINPFGQIGQVGHLRYLATGGISGGGLAMVGEQGRELVRLPTGSTVVPHGQSEAMLAGMSGGSGGVQRVELVVGPGGSQGLADLLMGMVRTGQLQLKAA